MRLGVCSVFKPLPDDHVLLYMCETVAIHAMNIQYSTVQYSTVQYSTVLLLRLQLTAYVRTYVDFQAGSDCMSLQLT